MWQRNWGAHLQVTIHLIDSGVWLPWAGFAWKRPRGEEPGVRGAAGYCIGYRGAFQAVTRESLFSGSPAMPSPGCVHGEYGHVTRGLGLEDWLSLFL